MGKEKLDLVKYAGRNQLRKEGIRLTSSKVPEEELGISDETMANAERYADQAIKQLDVYSRQMNKENQTKLKEKLEAVELDDDQVSVVINRAWNKILPPGYQRVVGRKYWPQISSYSKGVVSIDELDGQIDC